MGYFPIVSLIFGIWLVLGGLWFVSFPASYRDLALRMIPEKRPGWFLASALAMIVWVIYSWFRFSQMPDAAGAAISFILTLTLIKAYFFTFRYPEFRVFAQKFVGLETGLLRVIGLLYVGAGSALLALAFSD